MIASVKALISVLKASATMSPIAITTTLPCIRKLRNPLITAGPSFRGPRRVRGVALSLRLFGRRVADLGKREPFGPRDIEAVADEARPFKRPGGADPAWHGFRECSFE